MKRFFIILVALSLFFPKEKILGQNIIVDLSTGILNNTPSTQLPVGAFDDTWMVSAMQPVGSTAFPTNYFPVGCGTGVHMNSTGLYNYPFKDPNVRFLSPYLSTLPVPLFGNNLDVDANNNPIPAGRYYYRMTFNLPAVRCPIQSATLRFRHIGVDNQVNNIYVNGNPIPIPGGSFNLFSTNGTNITVPPGFLAPGAGLNTVIIVLDNSSGWTGLEINGDLFIQACGALDFTLTDGNGTEKSEYCLEEDVFINGMTLRSSSYSIKLYEVIGNTETWISQQSASGWMTGLPTRVNITDIFKHVTPYPVVLQGGKIYRVKLAINSACGVLEVQKDFSFSCCENSFDPSFSLYKKGNQLIGKSAVNGIHNWEIYTTSESGDITSGGFTFVDTDLPKFTYDLNSKCYLVTHWVTNECGSACSTQRFCNFACEDKDCNVRTPENASINNANLASWTGGGYAVSYIIEVTICDPLYCGGPPDGPAPIVVSIPAQSSPHQITAADFGAYGNLPQCFSYRIFAICQDGSRSNGTVPVGHSTGNGSGYGGAGGYGGCH